MKLPTSIFAMNFRTKFYEISHVQRFSLKVVNLRVGYDAGTEKEEGTGDYTKQRIYLPKQPER